ncbi:hypothetical protein ABIA36_001061 [Leifsonia sp. EB34]
MSSGPCALPGATSPVASRSSIPNSLPTSSSLRLAWVHVDGLVGTALLDRWESGRGSLRQDAAVLA